MGFSYLDDKCWFEVTREERFFCQRLFTLVSEQGERDFVEYLNAKLRIELDSTAEWELAFEVCFYRDYWHVLKKPGKPPSPKRTFDLCLFSNDTIVVIEAKAQQGFDGKQLRNLRRDKKLLADATHVRTVMLVGVFSDRYHPKNTTLAYFDGLYLTWRQLADHYSGDKILKRANSIYGKA